MLVWMKTVRNQQRMRRLYREFIERLDTVDSTTRMSHVCFDFFVGWIEGQDGNGISEEKAISNLFNLIIEKMEAR